MVRKNYFLIGVCCVGLLLSGCFHDETASTPVTAETKAVKVAVVGDVDSPSLANYLTSKELSVVDIPYIKYLATAPQIDGDYIVWSDNRNGNKDIFAYQISTATEFTVTAAVGEQRDPKIDGDYIVWSDFRHGNADIYGYQISTKTEFVVSKAAGSQRSVSLSGDYVVWSDSRGSDDDIYAYQFSSGLEIAVTTVAGDQWRPQISGDYIVWQHYENGFSDIYAYQVSTTTLFAVSTAAGSQYHPQIDGDYIVWTDNRNGADDDIYAFQISSETELPPISVAAGLQHAPQIKGDYIAWVDASSGNKDIKAYKISTAAQISVVNDVGEQANFSISDSGVIVWQDMRNTHADLYAYDLNTNQETRLMANTAEQTNPVIDGNNLAWIDSRRGLADIYFSADLGQNISLATNTWLTPAGVAANVDDYDVLVFASDFPDEASMLELFDAADSAGLNMLGLGGAGISLAATLANDSRYGISVTSAADCVPVQINASEIGDNSHALFNDLVTIEPKIVAANNTNTSDGVEGETVEVVVDPGPDVPAVIILETYDAESMDELAIATNTSASDSPASWTQRAYFGEDACNAGASAIIEFSTAKGSTVVLDGSANVADKYKYWWTTRWTLFENEVNYLLSK